ncbi:hypothetical protein [Sedimentitalea todarodis]|uniref:Uncharacterized protein n=1 Tax=Sedimentitalea todarodis TaxID=1631240 RepID=A0ABU3V9V8_9RHOB|nr:hypothetical protein [Sedimentitalea todarodis]MDU9002956.1 hypothetical protein [Sedimentitalea todarodis]
MAFATISTWKSEDDAQNTDAIWHIVQDKYVPYEQGFGSHFNPDP